MGFSFIPNKFKVFSTANPSPYWDRILLHVAIKSFAVSVQADGETEHKERIVALKSGDLGYCGMGGVVDLSTRPPTGESSWELVIPDYNPKESLSVHIWAENCRGLDDRDIERLLAQLAVISGEIAAGVLYHAPTKLLEVGAHMAFGLAGFGLDHLIHEILPDRPTCMGEVFNRRLPCDILRSLDFGPLEQISPGRHGHLSKSSMVHAAARPGSGCGTPYTKVEYAIVREHEMPPSFGKSPKTTTAFVVLDALNIMDVRGVYMDEPSQYGISPRVVVDIQPTVAPWQDGADVSVKEYLIDEEGHATLIVNAAFEEAQVQWLPMMRPGKNVLGTKLPGVLPESLFAKEGNLGMVVAKAGDDQILQPVSFLNESILKLTGQIAEAASVATRDRTLENAIEFEASPSFVDIVYLFPETATLPLSSHITLSFWRRTTYQSGKVVAEGIAIRYFRDLNGFATKTDVWLDRWITIK